MIVADKLIIREILNLHHTMSGGLMQPDSSFPAVMVDLSRSIAYRLTAFQFSFCPNQNDINSDKFASIFNLFINENKYTTHKQHNKAGDKDIEVHDAWL